MVLQRGLAAETRRRLAGDISGSSGVMHSGVAEPSATSPVVARDDERVFTGDTGLSSGVGDKWSFSTPSISSPRT